MKIRILPSVWTNVTLLPAVAALGESISVIPDTDDVHVELSENEPVGGVALVKLRAAGFSLSGSPAEGLWFYSDTGANLEINSTGSKDFYISSAGVAADLTERHFGYTDYNDTSSAATPVTLVPNTWTTLPNDGLGAFTKNRLPVGYESILAADGAIDCSTMPLDSDLIIRLDYTVTPNVNNSALFFRYQLGAGANLYTLERFVGRLDEGAGIPYRNSLLTDYLYLGDENTRDNPIYPQIKLTSGGSFVNAGMVIKVYIEGSN